LAKVPPWLDDRVGKIGPGEPTPEQEQDRQFSGSFA
jgi:hypothetical protein